MKRENDTLSENICNRFYTKRGREEDLARKAAAVSYYESLLQEVRRSYAGCSALEEMLET